MNEELEAFEMAYPTMEETYNGKRKFEPVPEGTYWVEVAQVRATTHARGPMFGLMFKIKEDALNDKAVGRVVWTNIIFLPYYSDALKTKVTPGAGIARGFLKAIDQEHKGERIKVAPKTWLGKSLGIRIKHDAIGKENVKAFLTVNEYGTSQQAPSAALPEEAIF